MSSRNYKTLRVGGTLTALAMTILIGQSANAQDPLRFLRNLGGYNVSYAEAQTAANLDAQRASLDARINSAAANRQISWATANGMRNQLTTNASLQAQLMADGFQFHEAQTLLNQLNSVESQLSTSIASGGFVGPGYVGPAIVGPGVVGPRFVGRGGGRNAQVDRMQARIRQNLERGRSIGRLTRGEYNRLMAELNRIEGRQMQFLASGGRINSSEYSRLVNRLSSLDQHLQREINDRQVAGRRYIPWY